MTDSRPPSGPGAPVIMAGGPENPAAAATQALMSGQIPKFYTNGLALAATATEITIICLDGTLPLAAVSLAYPTARSLAHDLEEGVKNFEVRTGEKVKTVNELMK